MPATYNVLVLPEGSEGNFAVVERHTETPQQMEIIGFFYKDTYAHGFAEYLEGGHEEISIDPEAAAEAFSNIMEKIMINGGGSGASTIINTKAQEVEEAPAEAPKVEEAPTETQRVNEPPEPDIHPTKAPGTVKTKTSFNLTPQQKRVLDVLCKRMDGNNLVQISQNDISRATETDVLMPITPGSVFYAMTRLANMGVITNLRSGFGKDATTYKVNHPTN